VAVRDGLTVATATRQGGPIDNHLLGDYGVSLDLLLGNAGTAMGSGNFILDDVPRMRKRPISDLINGLRQLGAKPIVLVILAVIK
jgi:5-enolpyruvylshikimate-3-phosphate synthase